MTSIHYFSKRTLERCDSYMQAFTVSYSHLSDQIYYWKVHVRQQIRDVKKNVYKPLKNVFYSFMDARVTLEFWTLNCSVIKHF